jgi:hypothetical protein
MSTNSNVVRGILHNAHGPTVYQGQLDTLVRLMHDLNRTNAGPYKLVADWPVYGGSQTRTITLVEQREEPKHAQAKKDRRVRKRA